MRCVICNSPDIEQRLVEEEIRLEQNIILVPIEVMVCLGCGERYYDRRMMRFLEEVEHKIAAKEVPLYSVGQVLKASRTLKSKGFAFKDFLKERQQERETEIEGGF